MKAKRLIVALIRETRSGKSTLASMCTDEDIHAVIAGTNGVKGTTKVVTEFTYIKNYSEFNLGEFTRQFEPEISHQEGRIKATLPLSANIKLSSFDAMTILDTQGLNDWKTDDEEKAVHASIIDVCDEADVIFVTLPDCGSVVSTNVILEDLFKKYAHKPIIFIYRSGDSRVAQLRNKKCVDVFKKAAEVNLQRYSEVYPGLSDVIERMNLPAEVGICPLLCGLPNSDELASHMDADERECDNIKLRGHIGEVLQYAITLQAELIDKMRDEYIGSNLEAVDKHLLELAELQFVAQNLSRVTFPAPLQLPYVHNFNFADAEDVEYSWQGGSRGNCEAVGGGYTYTAKDVYENISHMIGKLNCTLAVKSCLLSVLSSFSEERATPKGLNLHYPSYYTRGIPVDWLIKIRSEFFTIVGRDLRVQTVMVSVSEIVLAGFHNVFRDAHRRLLIYSKC